MAAKMALEALGQRILFHAHSLCRAVPLPTQLWGFTEAPRRAGLQNLSGAADGSQRPLEGAPAAGCHPCPCSHGLRDPDWLGREREPPWVPVPVLAHRGT